MKRLASLMLMCSLVPLTASAGTITVAWMGGPRVDAHYGVSPDSGGTLVHTYAGDFEITVTDPTGLSPLTQNQKFYTFCVDLQHRAAGRSSATIDSMADWDLLDGASPAQLARASWVGSQYFDAGHLGSSIERASYQIAIWELLYERSGLFNVTNGSAYFTDVSGAGFLTVADALVSASAAHTTVYQSLLRTADTPPYAQDFMAPNPVPDAGATLVLLGCALTGLGALRRKFNA